MSTSRPTRTEKPKAGIKTTSPPPVNVVAKPSADAPMRNIAGSKLEEFNSYLVNQALRTMGVMAFRGEIEKAKADHDAAITCTAAMAAFKPADEIEGMIAAQAVAMHFGSMECFRRSMIREQLAEMASKLQRDGANLARGMMDMMAALDRKRGKGQQRIVVERVTVANGGQAIVGNVQTGSEANAVPTNRVEPLTDGSCSGSGPEGRGRA